MTRMLTHPSDVRAAPRRRARPAPRPAPRPSLDDIDHIVLEDASWDLYEQLLRNIGNRPIRINYDDGRLEMMSPSPEREAVKRIIAKLIDALAYELGIEMRSLGSTTFRRADKQKGFEPDECFYFKHESEMRGRKRLNMKKDPPPELIVEVDITHGSVDREPIFAAFGVPEIWRWNGLKLECLELVNGAYRPRTHSLTFPFLAPADLTRFVKMQDRIGENALIRKFRTWVQKSGFSI